MRKKRDGKMKEEEKDARYLTEATHKIIITFNIIKYLKSEVTLMLPNL